MRTRSCEIDVGVARHRLKLTASQAYRGQAVLPSSLPTIGTLVELAGAISEFVYLSAFKCVCYGLINSHDASGLPCFCK